MRLQASRAYIWSKCPGAEHAPRVTSINNEQTRREGAAGHELLALSLFEPDVNRLGQTSTVGLEYDTDMLDGVNLFRKELGDPNQYTHVWVERDEETKHGNSELSVRPDVMAWDAKKKALHVYEYKYGFRQIEPYNNLQMLIAVSIFMVNLKLDIKDLHFTVVQPRGYHPDGPVRKWSISKKELEQDGIFHDLFDASMNVSSDNPRFEPGPQCASCRGARSCIPLKHKVSEIMSDIAKGKYEDLDPVALAYELSETDEKLTVLQARRDALYARALDYVNEGQIVPGYVHEGTSGQRFWKDKSKLTGYEAIFGVELHTKTPVTVKEAERRGLPDSAIKNNSAMAQGKPKIVKRDLSHKAQEVFK